MSSLEALEFLKKGICGGDNFRNSTVKNLNSYSILLKCIKRKRKLFQNHFISVLVVKSVCKYARKIYQFF